MSDSLDDYVTTPQAALVLGIRPESAGLLVRQGKIPAVKIANRWLILRSDLDTFAENYIGKPGRPRQKRKYTKRSPRWFNE
jgi:excisionase family DNA binding protein